MDYYCCDCHMIYEQDICPQCGKKLKLANKDDDCFLIEKKQIWADMLKEILENHHIPYYCVASMGAGISLKIGPMLESYQFFVPYSHYHEAITCVQNIFHDEDKRE